MFKRRSLSLAVTAAVATMTLGLTGCLQDETTNTTAPVTNSTANANSNTNINDSVRISNATGSIVGAVKDTNGNPIAGAKVYVGYRMVETTAGGTYQFNDVPVSELNTLNTTAPGGATETATNGSQVLLTIVPPTGYLGATVAVTPVAMIDTDSCQEIGGAGSVSSCEGGTSTSFFVDGFMANASTAILPKIGTTVTGILRNENTGEIIPNAQVSLDLTGAGGTLAQGGAAAATPIAANGNVYLATPEYTTTTDANGRFTIANAPADSTLNLNVDGYIVNSVGVAPAGWNLTNTTIGALNGAHGWNFNTNDETSTVELGNVVVDPILGIDQVAPFITGVASVVGRCTAAAPTNFGAGTTINGAAAGVANVAELRKGVDGTDANPIMISFSEPLVTTTADISGYVRVFQYLANGGSIEKTVSKAEIAANGRSLTVSVTEAIPSGETHFDVVLVDGPWMDTAQPRPNGLVVAGAAGQVPATVANNFITEYGPNNAIAKLHMCTFKSDAGATAGALTQLRRDTLTVMDDVSALQQYSNTFSDADDANGATTLSMLNNQDDNDNAGGPDVNARLTALASVIPGGAGTTINSNTARLSFVPGTAAGYRITVRRAGAAQAFAIPAASGIVSTSANTTVTVGAATATTQDFTVSGTDAVQIVLTGVNPGDVVSVTPSDAIGYTGTASTVTLVDNVPATTVLQRAYNAGNTATGASGHVSMGEGAELTNPLVGTAGVPSFPVTPHLVDNLNGTTAVGTATAAAKVSGDRNLSGEISSRNTTGTGAYATTGVVYDATAFASFAAAAQTRSIGVAFSEDVTVTGTPTTASFTSGPTGWTAQNDVIVSEHDGVGALPAAVSADLVRFTADVMKLGNGDHGKVIDFDGAISDSASNASGAETGFASTNAKVIVQDMLPPFVTKAIFNGTSFIITMNETVSLTGYTPRIVVNPGATQKIITLTAAMLGSDGVTITVPSANFNGLTAADFAVANSYNENTAYGTSISLRHAPILWDIRDARGNSWVNWTDTGFDVAGATGAVAVGTAGNGIADQFEAAPAAGAQDMRRVAFTAPQFASVSNIGTFTVTVDNTNFRQSTMTTADQSVTVTFSQPVTTSALGNATGTVAELNKYFKLSNVATTTDNSAITAADGSAAQPFTQGTYSWNTGRTVLTISGFRLTAALATSATLGQLSSNSDTASATDTYLFISSVDNTQKNGVTIAPNSN